MGKAAAVAPSQSYEVTTFREPITKLKETKWCNGRNKYEPSKAPIYFLISSESSSGITCCFSCQQKQKKHKKSPKTTTQVLPKKKKKPMGLTATETDGLVSVRVTLGVKGPLAMHRA